MYKQYKTLLLSFATIGLKQVAETVKQAAGNGLLYPLMGCAFRG